MLSLLYCDPSLANQILFRYGVCPGAIHSEWRLAAPPAEHILQSIVLKLDQQPITALALVNQATSFTVIRVLATIYNALAYSRQLTLYSLAVPTNWNNLSTVLPAPVDTIRPHYSAAPHIT